MNQQEILAKKHAPFGGYVCMTFQRGSNNWVFDSLKNKESSLDWFDAQTHAARVWKVNNGCCTIFCAK